jgi:hypothetical protein
LGQVGQKRVKEIYDWEVKGEIWDQIYREL